MINESSVILKLLFALGLGLFIGLERETSGSDAKDKKRSKFYDHDVWIGGFRTYTFVTVLGCLAGLFLEGVPVIASLVTGAVFLIFLVSYYVSFTTLKEASIINELVGVVSYLIGFMIGASLIPEKLIIAFAIIFVILLSRKQRVTGLLGRFNRSEILSISSFAIVALVILPFLPNQMYTFLDIPEIEAVLKAYHINYEKFAQLEIINPYKTWFIVALVSGVNFVGYFLSKFVGKAKGLLVTSLVGGSISSTSVTTSLAIQTKKAKTSQLGPYLAAALLANASSFVEIMILILPLNPDFFVKATPMMGAMIVSGFLLGYIILKKMESGEAKEVDVSVSEEPFALQPAIKFALVLTLIRAATKAALVFLGDKAFVITSMLASLTGVDAVVINLAELTGRVLTTRQGLVVLLAVNAVNLASKTVISLTQGQRKFALYLGAGFAAILALAGATLAF